MYISHRQHVIFFKREIFFVNPLSPGTGSLYSLLFLNSICYKLARISTSVLGLCCCAVRMMCFRVIGDLNTKKYFCTFEIEAILSLFLFPVLACRN